MFERLKSSQKHRDRVAGFWFLLCILVSLAGLHVLTDFEVDNPDWWIYVFQVVTVEHRPPFPYVWSIAAIFGLYFSGILLCRLSFKPTEYGDARAAKKADLKKMELDGKDNMIIGHFGKEPIIPRNCRHTLVTAGTRSGKTQGIAVPTLHNYQGSAVVIDPKGELWETTAGHRSKFSDCYRLEWTAQETTKYNPISLTVLPTTPAEIELRVIQVATILMPPGDSFWTKEAHKACRALILFEIYNAIYEGRDASLANVAHFSGDLDVEPADAGEDDERESLNSKLFEAAELAKERGHPRLCQSDLTELASTASRQLSGVFGTLSAELQILKTLAVENSINGCDINPKMLVEGERPVTIYIVVKPKDTELTAILTTTLITNFILDLVSRTSEEAKRQHTCLFILEEFSAMKKTPAIGELMDRGAGLGVHGLIVIQSFSQVRQIYSEDELKNFINNSDYLVVFAVTDADTQSWLERLVGKSTRRRESRSMGDKGHDSTNVSHEGTPLILAQEWGEIPQGEHRILVRYHTTRPIFAKTRFAFKDPAAKKRMALSPPPVRIARGYEPPRRPSSESEPTDEQDLVSSIK